MLPRGQRSYNTDKYHNGTENDLPGFYPTPLGHQLGGGRTVSGRPEVLDAEQAALVYHAFALQLCHRPRHLGDGVRRESPVLRGDLLYDGLINHPLGRVVPVGQPHLLSDEYPAWFHRRIVNARGLPKTVPPKTFGNSVSRPGEREVPGDVPTGTPEGQSDPAAAGRMTSPGRRRGIPISGSRTLPGRDPLNPARPSTKVSQGIRRI